MRWKLESSFIYSLRWSAEPPVVAAAVDVGKCIVHRMHHKNIGPECATQTRALLSPRRSLRDVACCRWGCSNHPQTHTSAARRMRRARACAPGPARPPKGGKGLPMDWNVYIDPQGAAMWAVRRH